MTIPARAILLFLLLVFTFPAQAAGEPQGAPATPAGASDKPGTPGASIDLQNARCKDIMTLHEDDAVLLYFWLDGYLYRERELPILDLDAAAKAITHMAEYCAAKPDAPLREALLRPAP